jgi:hypothetical protein
MDRSVCFPRRVTNFEASRRVNIAWLRAKLSVFVLRKIVGDVDF